MSTAASSSPGNRLTNNSRFSRWIPIGLVLLLVVWPLTFYGLGSEIESWQIDAATEVMLDQGYPAGIERLNGALEKKPDSASLLRVRADWLAETGDYAGAIQDLQRVIKLNSDSSSESGQSFADHARLLDWMTTIRQEAAKRELDAIASEFKDILDGQARVIVDGKPNDGVSNTICNDIAYFHSRMSYRLDEAAAWAERACRSYNNPVQNYRLAGEAYLALDRYETAIDCFDRALLAVDTSYQQAKSRLAETGTEAMAFGVPPENDELIRLKSTLTELHVVGERLHAIYHGRSQAHRKLGHTEAAAEDARRAQKCGLFDNGDAQYQASDVLGNRKLISYFSSSSSFLDTRGCVRLQQKKFALAIEDFDQAIVLHELLLKISGETVRPLEVIDPREVALQRTSLDRVIASLRYHRFLAWQESGDQAKADQDRQVIEQLGFELNPQLF
jgi:tetratricopeptide (TPR) repeat protein